MINWTDWQKIIKNSVEKSAVYQVRMVDDDLKPYSINRFLDTDKDGIVCIGESSNMEQRRKKFLSGIKYARGHSSMNLVYYLERHTKLKEIFNPYSFQYRYSTCKASERKRIKSKLTKEYFKQFGEVPPLNSVLPNRYDGW